MKSIIASAATLLALTASTTATLSKPFYLSIHSQNKTLNGVRLSTCHEGAAIEGLCVLGGSEGIPFQFNKTGTNNYGTLIYNLKVGTGSGTQNVPSALQFNPSLLSTNVLHPEFLPDYEGVGVNFDSANRLYIPVYYDDTVNPPQVNKESKLYNWFLCQANIAGYVYETVNWVVGRGKLVPTNPSCRKVDIIRQFA